MPESSPVLLIGLDAMEIARIEELIAQGQLPNLAALRRSGCWGLLEPRPQGFLTMVWPTFFTGTRVSHHGWYYGKMWRPERMRLEFARPDWLPQQAFWDDLPRELRIALIDVPFSPRPGPAFNGVYLNSWQCHDDSDRHAHPSGLWRELRARFGERRMTAEYFGRQSPASLLRLRHEMLACTDQIGEIAAWLLGRERWDLFALVFGTAHRAGHYLWDLSNVGDAADKLDADVRRELEGAHTEIYVACDRALGRVLASAPSDARVLVFALHGMGPETGWSEKFPRLLAQIQGVGAPPAAGTGLVYRAKRALPWSLVRQVTTRLPIAANQMLVPLWSGGMYDWSKTRCFALPGDIGGYLRINLKGREARGIVEPGREYEELCDRLAEAFLSYRDIETDEPVVAAVDRVDDLVGADAPRRHLLPDLVVRWAARPATHSSGVRSPQHGEVRWCRGAPLFSGRCGNHLGTGWFVAAGPGIEAGARVPARETADLLPTVFDWLGQPQPARFQGNAIRALVGSSARVPA